MWGKKGCKAVLSRVTLIVICAALIVSVASCGKKAPPEPLDEAKVFNRLTRN